MKIAQCFLLMILLCKTCKFPDEGSFFTMVNNANHPISHYIDFFYPDTIIVLDKPYIYVTQPISSKKDADWGTWEERFSKIEKISIFIFHTDTLNKYTWDEVRERYMVLKRYDLNLNDLKRLDFKISYPLTEAMKDIKQYPPYDDNVKPEYPL